MDATAPAFTLHHGDCLDVLKTLPDNSVDAVVTDPPYGLSNHTAADTVACLRAWLNGDEYRPDKGGFMGKAWDAWVPGPEVWREALRVLKPGGHLLCFGGSRTVDLMGIALRLAGFEVRDTIMWIYGSGFPKSLDISKAIDKEAGAERQRIGSKIELGVWASKKGQAGQGEAWKRPWMDNPDADAYHVTIPATPAAAQFAGFGTALKPAHEPIILARKPLQGTVAENVLQWGTGGLNIDGCRIETAETLGRAKGVWGNAAVGATNYGKFNSLGITKEGGRWPANVIHDGSAEVVAGFPETTSGGGSGYRRFENSMFRDSNQAAYIIGVAPDTGSAARFFYCAKASKSDRDEGLEDWQAQQARTTYDKSVRDAHGNDSGHPRANHHPTVKPTSLMRYICRLITPPGGIVLDPFMGSGSTGKAAVLEGFRFVGIEREAEYLEIARARIHHAAGMPPENNADADSVRTGRDLSVQRQSRIPPVQARLL